MNLEAILNSIDVTQLLLFVITSLGGAFFMWAKSRIAGWRAFWRDVVIGIRTLPELEAQVKGLCKYITPSGGGALMDSVRRTESAVATLTDQVELVMHVMWAENDIDDEVGRFHCNPEGENTYVSQMYARWLGVGKPDLLGWQWVNYIHPNDQQRVRSLWDACRAEHRQFRARYVMQSVGGNVFEVETVVTPIPDRPPAKRWVGTVRRLDV